MPQNLNHQENILNILQDFHGLDPLRELFWTELNYDRQNDGIPRGKSGQTQPKTPSLTIQFFLRQAEQTTLFTSSMPVSTQTVCC